MFYIIPTPIWNKDDISLRALKLFESLEYFICENTSTFKKLLKLYNIDYFNKKFFVINSFVDDKRLQYYLDLWKENDLWIVSESWTPWFSDPGKSMIKKIWENWLKFEVLPWANALILSVVWAFFDTSSFTFYWFLPKKKWKSSILKKIILSEHPVFIYESVHRVEKTLNEIKNLWFDWKVWLFRELTKMFEQKECDQIDSILEKIKSKHIPLKWEFVIWFYNLKK